MNMRSLLLFVLFLGAFSQTQLFAQADSDTTRQKVVVLLNNGTERIGYVISDDGRELLLETLTMGKIFISKNDIKSITPIGDDKHKEVPEDEYILEGPFTTRYYFTTNALPIKKKENYAMIHLYGPEVHFALTNRLSLGVMTTWIASPLVLAAKYTIPTKNKKLNYGIGTLMGTSGYLFQFRGFGGLHWGMATYGDRFNNLTLSAGYFYAGMGGATYDKPGIYASENGATPKIAVTTYTPMSHGPALGLGGTFRVGRKASLILDGMLIATQSTQEGSTTRYVEVNGNMQAHVTQNKAFTNYTTVLYMMPAMRFQRTETTAFQIALAGVSIFRGSGESNSFPVPMCSWLRKF